MRLVILLIASVVTLSACEMFSQCDPTPDQHDWCEWHNDWSWFAIGRYGTDGVCEDHEFLCSNGEQSRAALTAGGAGGEVWGAGGGFGGGDASCPSADGGVSDCESDMGAAP